MSKRAFAATLIALLVLLVAALLNSGSKPDDTPAPRGTPADLSIRNGSPDGKQVVADGRTGILKAVKGPPVDGKPQPALPASAFAGKNARELLHDTRPRRGTRQMKQVANRLIDVYGSDYNKKVPSLAEMRRTAKLPAGMRMYRLTSTSWTICARTTGIWLCYSRAPSSQLPERKGSRKSSTPMEFAKPAKGELDPAQAARSQGPDLAGALAVARSLIRQYEEVHRFSISPGDDPNFREGPKVTEKAPVR